MPAGGRDRRPPLQSRWRRSSLGIGALVLFVILIIPELRALSTAISDAIADLEAQLASGSVEDGVRLLLQAAEGIWNWLATEVGGLVGTVASVVTVGILALFLTFFVLSDGDRAERWALQGTPEEHRERIRAADGEALRRVGGLLRGMAAVSVVLIVAYGAALAVLGVPHVAESPRSRSSGASCRTSAHSFRLRPRSSWRRPPLELPGPSSCSR